MIIREMVIDDIYRGYLRCLSPLASVDLTLPEATLLFKKVHNENSKVFICYEEDRNTLVGTIKVILERKFIHRGGLVGHIEDLSVASSWQKFGYGKDLLRHAIEFCNSLGCYKVILNCRKELVPFYEKYNFEQHGVSMRLDMCGQF